MENLKQYTHCYSLTAADMNNEYRMTASAVLLYYQDCWARYMSCLNMAAFDLVHHGLMWIISEFNAAWDEGEAYWSEEVIVKVWNSELTGLRLYADFVIAKKDGTQVAHGSGCWTLLDISCHRPVSISDVLDTDRLAVTEGSERHKKVRIPAATETILETEHKVNPINLDFNGHVNNRTYLNIAMQTVEGGEMSGLTIKNLTIRWLRETFLGDMLVCRLCRVSMPADVADGKQTGGNQTGGSEAYLHLINKGDETVAQVYAVLEPRRSTTIIDTVAPRD